MLEGAVVLHSADADLQLQAVRTTLSLALGDRPARLFVLGNGAAILAADARSEAGRCLAALKEAEIQVWVESETGPPPGTHASGPRVELLREIAAAPFQQTF